MDNEHMLLNGMEIKQYHYLLICTMKMHNKLLLFVEL